MDCALQIVNNVKLAKPSHCKPDVVCRCFKVSLNLSSYHFSAEREIAPNLSLLSKNVF